jgi:hypothetical protein
MLSLAPSASRSRTFSAGADAPGADTYFDGV